MRWASKIWADQKGNFALTTALMTIPVLIGIGIAVDLANLQRAKSSLRNAVETAAVASAKSFNSTDDERRERATLMLAENFDIQAYQANKPVLDVALTERRSTVEAKTVMPTKLMSLIGQKELSLSVKVAAETVLEPACILINAPMRSEALKFQGHPSLNTVDCYVHVNSTSSTSANAQGNPQLTESEVCLNGGFTGKKWAPGPDTQCGERKDPYADIQKPNSMSCDHNRIKISNKGTTELTPGHFCGGLKLPANSDVKLAPGIYHISDGALDISANANISGDGVMFYLSDAKSNFEIHSGGNWNITPPISGEYRGIAIFQDRHVKPHKPNKITGGGSLNMTGIIYAINSHLELQGSPSVTLTGAGTMVLVDTMTLQGSPEFILKSVENPELLPNDKIIGRDAHIRVIY